MHCGSVRKGDVLYLKDGNVGRLGRLWALAGVEAVSAQIDLFQPVVGAPGRWDASAPTQRVVDSKEIMDACIWAEMEGSIRVIAPFRALL